MEQVRLKCNLIVNGSFIKVGTVMNREDIPMRLRKETFIGSAVAERREEPEEIELEEPPPRRILRRR